MDFIDKRRIDADSACCISIKFTLKDNLIDCSGKGFKVCYDKANMQIHTNELENDRNDLIMEIKYDTQEPIVVPLIVNKSTLCNLLDIDFKVKALFSDDMIEDYSKVYLAIRQNAFTKKVFKISDIF